MVDLTELQEELAKKEIELEDRKIGNLEKNKELIDTLQQEIEQLRLELRGISPRKQRRTAFLDECAG